MNIYFYISSVKSFHNYYILSTSVILYCLQSRNIARNNIALCPFFFCLITSTISIAILVYIFTRRIYFRMKCMLEIVLEWNNKGCTTYNCMRNFNTMRRIISVQFPRAFSSIGIIYFFTIQNHSFYQMHQIISISFLTRINKMHKADLPKRSNQRIFSLSLG